MAYTPKGAHGVINTTSMTTYYNVPTGKNWLIKQLVLSNKGTVAHTVSARLATYGILSDLVLDPDETFVLDLTQVLAASEAVDLQNDTTGTDVTYHLGYVEFP